MMSSANLPRVSHSRLAAAVSATLFVPHLAPAQSRVMGLDVSDWQGNINWTSVATAGGKGFAFIRSTRGGTTGTYNEVAGTGTLSQRYDDTKFVFNITNATANGLYVSPYHFARADIASNTGVDEANHMLQIASLWMRPGYLLPVYDLEATTSSRSPDNLAQFVVDFGQTIYNATGVWPIVYSSSSYASDGLVPHSGNNTGQIRPVVAQNMPNLWIARWPNQSNPSAINLTGDPPAASGYPNVYGVWNPTYPNTPTPSPWRFWQYASQNTSVPGIAGNVDLDISHGTIEYVKDLLIPALWTAGSSGDWSTLANWNSNNPTYVAGNPATGPAPRLPGVDDTVILDNTRSPNPYAVTLSTGSQNIRKLYVREPLNITGGALTINYDPTTPAAVGSAATPGSAPLSAQLSNNVSMSGGSLSVHTLLVDPGRTFTLAGGTLTLNTLTLTNATGAAPAKLSITGNLTVNPLGNAASTINVTNPASANNNAIDLGSATRTLTIGDGTAPVDLTINTSIGNGSITKDGPGTLQLNNSATFNAPVTISAGTLISSQNNQLGTAVTTSPTGSLYLSGNLSYSLPLTIGGAGALGIAGIGGNPSSPGNPGSLHASSGSPTWSGPITLTGTGATGTAATINQLSAAAGATLTLSGVISSPSTGALAKSDAGDLVLTGTSPNTYPGLTRLYGGRLIVEKDAALGTAASHTFQLAGSASSIAFRAPASSPTGFTYATQEVLHTEGTGFAGLAQVDNLSGNNTFAGSIALAGPADTASLGVSAGSLTLTGGLYARTGYATTSRTLNKTGPGTLTLTGDSSLPPTSPSAIALTSSTLNITAGTVDLRSPNPSSANVPALTTYAVSPGATLLNTAGTLSDVTLSIAGTYVQSAARLQNASLSVSPGGYAQLQSSASSPSLLTSLTLSPDSTLDVTTNTVLMAAGGNPPVQTIRQYLHDHLLLSSTANSDPQHLLTLAYLQNPDASLTIQPTYYGDANLDGAITPDDYALLDRGFNKQLSTWSEGDFNYDGVVDQNDYLLIDTTYYHQSQTLTPTFLAQREAQFGPAYVQELLTTIPEPSSPLAACALALLAMTHRHRRHASL